MTYDVVVSDQAQEDLRNIYSYIALELKSIINAGAQLDSLESEISSLSEMPERYILFPLEPWHSRNVRIVPVGNYSVIYHVDRENCVVSILRVLYGGSDISAKLDLPE